eukprot:COSAG01_NODE_228_length_21104_cov_210.303832_30_plen_239_part_00
MVRRISAGFTSETARAFNLERQLSQARHRLSKAESQLSQRQAELQNVTKERVALHSAHQELTRDRDRFDNAHQTALNVRIEEAVAHSVVSKAVKQTIGSSFPLVKENDEWLLPPNVPFQQCVLCLHSTEELGEVGMNLVHIACDCHDKCGMLVCLGCAIHHINGHRTLTQRDYDSPDGRGRVIVGSWWSDQPRCPQCREPWQVHSWRTPSDFAKAGVVEITGHCVYATPRIPTGAARR